jgi:hypothetical protein
MSMQSSSLRRVAMISAVGALNRHLFFVVR